ncbi:hypothetical protein [Sphaerisporangium krabiense]|uniref:Uncharacterized protein n=1 Tax=Sphaerisporangium krabiense TaxID=763782 RepID=A0A7W9DQ94_9ACTN|nr:hypothetical protein [Sphaerisporangium krabiense]MBB5627173.1 hypothetical protein [Sphaerisporangium krabiense]
MGSALVGAVLGAAVQEVLTTELRLAAAIAVVLCVTVIGLFAALLATLESRRQADIEVSESNQALLWTVRKEAVELGDRFQQASIAIAAEVRDLSKRFGLHVEQLLLEEVNAMDSLDDDKTAQLMLSAQQELFVLDLISEEGHWPDGAMQADHSKDFFETLVQKVRGAPPSFTYKRIVQVSDPLRSLRNAKTTGFIRHCHAMLDLRKRKGHRVTLRVARRRFPFKFMLMDRTKLVIQLQEYSDVDESLRIWGEILISDPSSELIKIFLNIWAELDDDQHTRTVRIGELPPLAQDDPA